MNWLPGIFRRNQLYGDLGEEMRLHLEERTEQFMGEGMSRREAEQAARRAFGNATLLEERSREVWQFPLVESLAADLKLVFRRLGKSPGFAATVILTLAIGIGANAAVFSVLNSVLFKPLPYPHAEQLVAVRMIAPGAAGLADFSNGLPSRPRCISRSPSRIGRFKRSVCGTGAQPMSPASPSRMKCTQSRSPTVCCKRSVSRPSLAAGSCRLIKIRMVRKQSCSATAIGNAASAEIHP